MKMNLRFAMRPLLALMAALFLSQSVAWAYPPAPNSMIYGQVTDQYGNPLTNPNDLVVLQTTTGVQVVAQIQPNLAAGINYVLQIPMDAGSIPGVYVSNALTMGTQFQLLVVINSVTNTPNEMQGTNLTLGAPSQRLEQNLSFGQNVGNSGIPLSWAESFLASLGLNIPPGSINPNGIYTSDGRSLLQEYLLGNYPYQTNAFTVKIVKQTAGAALLSFTPVTGRTISALGSTDLASWTPISFTIPSIGPTVLTSYTATTNLPLQLQTVSPSPTPKFEFFRLQLQ